MTPEDDSKNVFQKAMEVRRAESQRQKMRLFSATQACSESFFRMTLKLSGLFDHADCLLLLLLGEVKLLLQTSGMNKGKCLSQHGRSDKESTILAKVKV